MSALSFTFSSAVFLLLTLCTHVHAARIPLDELRRVNKQDIIYSAGISSIKSTKIEGALRQIIPQRTCDVANIKQSRLGYSQIPGIAGGIVIPGQPDARPNFMMEIYTKLNGTLTSDVQGITDKLVLEFSSNFRDWYNEETKSLKARAGGGFFSFFQAAANYGFSNNKRTQDILQTEEFKSFSEKTGARLQTLSVQELEISTKGLYSTDYLGGRGTISFSAYIFINQITLDSGKIFNVVSSNSILIISNQYGDILNDTTTLSIHPSGNSGDNLIDTAIGG